MPHSGQTNDLTASVSMSAYLSRPFTWTAPIPWNIGGSDNQKAEGRLAGLLQNPNSSVARRTFLATLQAPNGDPTPHQGGEFGTPSHAPHWYRLMSVAKWWSHNNLHITDIATAIDRWWAEDLWIRNRYRIPSGPLKNRIIGWGARDNGFKGHNDIRDIVDAILSNRPLDGKSKHIVSNAINNKDTFSLHVLSDLMSKGAFSGIIEVRPIIAYDLTINVTSESLTCECKNPDPKDPHNLTVDFASGNVAIE
jgi:hypothetical protein